MELTKAEIDRLTELGRQIVLGLTCDVNGSGFPCRTDRLACIEGMKEYLEIHEVRCAQLGSL